MSFETIIFSNILLNEEYGRKVFPFLKDEYFTDYTDKVTFKLIKSYVDKYHAFPSKEALAIDLSNSKDVNDSQFEQLKNQFEQYQVDGQTSLDWLVDETEKFCQDKSIYNAIHESIKIMNDTENSRLTKDAIPDILQDALAVSFDTSIGHDFLEDFDRRYEFYHRIEERVPFDIEYFNLITKGGLPKKSLSVLIGGTGVFKTGAMCHMAATNLMDGKNVLYITLEMAEERIAERIESNLIDIPVDELSTMPIDMYQKKINKLRKKTTGKLIIKEYPTGSAGSSHFRYLLNELKIKKKFIPDIIYIDYINICCSSRIKMGGSVNSYSYIKAIAEELRGLAVESNTVIISGTQYNRTGMNSSDPTLTDTSESAGLPFTVDFMLAIIETEELRKLGQLVFKQLKNRFGSLDLYNKFCVGVDKTKMRLYNLDQSAQDLFIDNGKVGPVDDSPVMDNSTFFQNENERKGKKFNKSMFDNFS